MAQMPLSSYQIVLIIILVLNLIFWIVVICWRIAIMDGLTWPSRMYRRIFRIFNRREENQTIPSICREQVIAPINVEDLPPSYEEAIKYPSVASLLRVDTNMISSNLTNNAFSIISIGEISGNCSLNLNSRNHQDGPRRSLSFNDFDDLIKNRSHLSV